MGSRVVLLMLKRSRRCKDPGAGAQASACTPRRLRSARKIEPQGCRVCHGPEASAEHQEP